MPRLQQEIMADYADMKAAVAAADTLEAKQAAATNASKCHEPEGGCTNTHPEDVQ